MSNQADVHSIEALKSFRVALALFSEDALGALGAVESEIRRTLQWLQHDRPLYWQDQLKRRRERVATAKADLFRRQIAKRPDSSPSTVEQKEALRLAEASLQEAETRVRLVKKWETALQQAIFEYHGTTRRLKDLASSDAARAMALLERMVDALEAYLRVEVPSGGANPSGTTTALESIAGPILEEFEATDQIEETGESSTRQAESPTEPNARE